MSKLKTIFKGCRIVGIAGIKNSGKTNNLISLIVDYRKTKDTDIYVYGLPGMVMQYLKRFKVKEISQLSHLVGKKNCLLILDEFQKLKLNDRRYKDELSNLIDFVYHNNVYLILCSPSLREFNSVIGGVIEKWLLKSVRLDLCINGSQLKNVIQKYKGSYKELDSIEMPLGKFLLINSEEEILIDCPYIKKADNKSKQVKLF